MESLFSPSVEILIKKIILPKGIWRENTEDPDLLDYCIEDVDGTFQLESDKKLHFEEKRDVITTKNNPTPFQQRSISINSLVDVLADESINRNVSFLHAIQKLL